MVERKKSTRKKTRRKASSRSRNSKPVIATPEKEIVGDANDKGSPCARIKLDDSLTISNAVAFKDQLSACLDKYNKVEIDGSAVELIDTAALQILVSFIKQSRQDSVEVSWSGQSEVLVKTSALLGLTNYL